MAVPTEPISLVIWFEYCLRDANLTQADQCGRRREFLPLLAEAAPDEFLKAVRAGVMSSPPLLAKLFTDAQPTSGFSASSPHTGLLWALENPRVVAREHFGQSIDLLARLAEVDPGGRLSNRPFNSLAQIFTPWHPETAVGTQGRLAAIDALRQRHEQIAWQLMIALLPTNQAVHFPTHEPEHRDWKAPEEPVLTVEYLQFVGEITNRVLQDAGAAQERWDALLDASTQLPPDGRRQIRDALSEAVDRGTFTEDDGRFLWTKLRQIVAQHREFDDANWALPTDEVDELAGIADRLEPADPTVRHAWLFESHRPDLGDRARRDDHEAYDAALASKRRIAIAEIEEAEGFKAVRKLAEESVDPWAVGVGLAAATGSVHDLEVIHELDNKTTDPIVRFAHGYVVRQFQQEGWTWVEDRLAGQLTPVQQARLLLATYDFPAWELAEERTVARRGPRSGDCSFQWVSAQTLPM